MKMTTLSLSLCIVSLLTLTELVLSPGANAQMSVRRVNVAPPSGTHGTTGGDLSKPAALNRFWSPGGAGSTDSKSLPSEGMLPKEEAAARDGIALPKGGGTVNIPSIAPPPGTHHEDAMVLVGTDKEAKKVDVEKLAIPSAISKGTADLAVEKSSALQTSNEASVSGPTTSMILSSQNQTYLNNSSNAFNTVSGTVGAVDKALKQGNTQEAAIQEGKLYTTCNQLLSAYQSLVTAYTNDPSVANWTAMQTAGSNYTTGVAGFNENASATGNTPITLWTPPTLPGPTN